MVSAAAIALLVEKTSSGREYKVKEMYQAGIGRLDIQASGGWHLIESKRKLCKAFKDKCYNWFGHCACASWSSRYMVSSKRTWFWYPYCCFWGWDKCNSWRLCKQWSQVVCTSSCACSLSIGWWDVLKSAISEKSKGTFPRRDLGLKAPEKRIRMILYCLPFYGIWLSARRKENIVRDQQQSRDQGYLGLCHPRVWVVVLETKVQVQCRRIEYPLNTLHINKHEMQQCSLVCNCGPHV